MKKYFIVIGIIAVIILISIFWADIARIAKTKERISINETIKEEKNIKIGLITGFGGLGDKSFNDMQYNGIVLAKKLYGVDFQYFSPQNFQDIINETQALIDDGCKLIIIGEGYIGQKILDLFALKYSDTTFIVLDNKIEKLYPNTAAVVFKQNEASFLAGFLAGEMTKKNSVGFIGGAKVDVIEDFYLGFTQGVKYSNQKSVIYKEFLSDYIKDFEKVWDNPEVAYDVAKNLISKKGVDIIFAVAAASNIGIFNACKNYRIFSIGVDTDQDYIIPGTILTSVMKNLDQAIVFIVGKYLKKDIKPIIYYLGIKENGVALSPMLYTKDLIGEERIKKIYSLQKKIIDNEISVDSIFNDYNDR